MASRFGRSATPSGVVMLSGMDTSTQAIAPCQSSPALLIAPSSSGRSATLVRKRLAVLVTLLAPAEDPHHRVVIGPADRLPVFYDRPAHRQFVAVVRGRGGGGLDGKPPAISGPVE